MKVHDMEIVILDSAYKHGITEESIRSCLRNVRDDELIGYPPPKYLLAGFDHLAKALEIIAEEDDNGERLTVFHAMRLRKKYNYLLGGN